MFVVDLHEAIGKGLTLRSIDNMVNHETNELFFDNLEIPAENLIGEEGQGVQVHPRRPERGARAHRRRMHRRRLLVRRARDEVRKRARRVRPADRQEPGRAVPDRRGLRRGRGREPHALPRLRAVRRKQAVRRRGEHGEAARGQGVVGRRRTPACRRTAVSASRASTTSSASFARRACTRSRRSRRI